MIIGIKLISGFMLGLEFNFDLRAMMIDIGIVRLVFALRPEV